MTKSKGLTQVAKADWIGDLTLESIDLTAASDLIAASELKSEKLDTFTDANALLKQNASLKIELLNSIRVLWPLVTHALIARGFIPKGAGIELVSPQRRTVLELLDLEAHLVEIIKKSLDSEGEPNRRLDSDGKE